MIRLAVFLIVLLGVGPALAQSSHSLELLTEANNPTIIPRYLLQDPNGRSITNEDFPADFIRLHLLPGCLPDHPGRNG